MDVAEYASIEGITKDVAAAELAEAVNRGFLTRMYMFPRSSELPLSIVVAPEDVGRTVTLADVGYIGDNEDREITLSSHDAKEIFVAPEAGK